MNPSSHVDVLLHAELWRAKAQEEADTIKNEKNYQNIDGYCSNTCSTRFTFPCRW